MYEQQTRYGVASPKQLPFELSVADVLKFGVVRYGPEDRS